MSGQSAATLVSHPASTPVSTQAPLALPAAHPTVAQALGRPAFGLELTASLPLAAHGVQPAVLPVPAAPDPTPGPGVSLSVNGGTGGRSQAVSIIIMLTILSIVPALLLLTTSFTKMIVVFSLTRNALGTPSIPPNQVLAGLALFLSIYVMSPVLSQVNEQGLQPYLKGTITEAQAFERGAAPLRTFMLKQTGRTELQTMIKLSKEAQPADEKDVSLTTLVPAFMLSELKAAFIIGFVIFVPFLVIDIVVSSTLMAMGMMMLPPIMISLPFKLLLFVLVDGWSLISTSLVGSYH